jgi:hypothetical protein
MKRLCIAALVMLCGTAQAEGITWIVEAGPVTTVGESTRLALSVPTRFDWLKTEVGILGTSSGSIVDITPMLHYGKSWYVEGGIGLGDNMITKPNQQAEGLIFHDVVCGGHKWNKNLIRLCAEHWSNGGSLNPIFGKEPNNGYSGIMIGYGRSF